MALDNDGNERHAQGAVAKWGFALGGILVALMLVWLLATPGDQNTRHVATPPADSGQASRADRNTGSAVPPPTRERAPDVRPGVPAGGAGGDSARGSAGPATGTERQR